MEGSSSSTAQKLCQSWSPLLTHLCDDPRVGWLLNTKLGQYLRQHPVLGLMVLVFSIMAVLPVGLFVIFALVTLIVSAVGFVFFEVFLLFVAGLTLLFTLSGLAFFSVLVSFIFSAFYLTFTNLYKGYYPRVTTQRNANEEENVDPQN